MERNSIQIKKELQDVYWEFLEKRAIEYKSKGLTGRLVIDFRKGIINSIFDQSVVAGVSALSFYTEKMDT